MNNEYKKTNCISYFHRREVNQENFCSQAPLETLIHTTLFMSPDYFTAYSLALDTIYKYDGLLMHNLNKSEEEYDTRND
jgi:hypothetical protein